MDDVHGIPYENHQDLPADEYNLTTTYDPFTPTQGVMSSSCPAPSNRFNFPSMRPTFTLKRRNADYGESHVIRNCKAEEMAARYELGQLVEDVGLGPEFRPDLPGFKQVVTRRPSHGREQERESSAQRRLSQRNPSLPRQRSRSRSRARAIALGNDDANPPVPALPSEHRARTAATGSIETNRPSERPVLSVDTSVQAAPEDNQEPHPDSGVDLRYREDSISTLATQRSLGGSSNAETRRPSTAQTSMTDRLTLRSTFPPDERFDPVARSSRAAIEIGCPNHSISRATSSVSSLSPGPPTPTPLPQPSSALHVNFAPSSPSRPRLKPGLFSKLKNSVHNIDKSISRLISRRKDTKYASSLSSRKRHNKSLDSSIRAAISTHTRKQSSHKKSLKAAIKAQKRELKICKKRDKESKRKAEREQVVREKMERERRLSTGLGRVEGGMFGWRLWVDGAVRWPVRWVRGRRD